MGYLSVLIRGGVPGVGRVDLNAADSIVVNRVCLWGIAPFYSQPIWRPRFCSSSQRWSGAK